MYFLPQSLLNKVHFLFWPACVFVCFVVLIQIHYMKTKLLFTHCIKNTSNGERVTHQSLKAESYDIIVQHYIMLVL